MHVHVVVSVPVRVGVCALLCLLLLCCYILCLSQLCNLLFQRGTLFTQFLFGETQLGDVDGVLDTRNKRTKHTSSTHVVAPMRHVMDGGSLFLMLCVFCACLVPAVWCHVHTNAASFTASICTRNAFSLSCHCFSFAWKRRYR